MVLIQYSIIIPTCNRSDYLAVCCKEIHVQIKGKEVVEVIVIDDGSQELIADDNKSICEKFGFSYTYQCNRGMAVARNTGIARSSGVWIIFLDDDVLISDGWFTSIQNLLSALPMSVVGIEGMVEGSGEGVWDREVQNLKGGAYLTCHLAVKRDILIQIGMFDTAFEKLGPFCEDHELAARLLKKGDVKFDTTLRVTHLPRKVKLFRYMLNAPLRITGLIKADLYFYCKHRAEYKLFRHAATFWGTYYSVLFRNVFKCLKRRSMSRIAGNLLQTVTLVTAAIIEQLWAWFLIPVVLKNYWKMSFKKKDPS